MQISMWVPYDEARLRRTIRFVLRPQLKQLRVLGGVIAALGLFLVALDPTASTGYAAGAVGLGFVLVVPPITVSRTVRMQSDVLKDGHHMTIDEEWVTVSYPLAESRLKWPALERVIETSDVWYIMFGKYQAVTIVKEPMTEQQRAEFGAFVAQLPPRRPLSRV